MRRTPIIFFAIAFSAVTSWTTWAWWNCRQAQAELAALERDRRGKANGWRTAKSEASSPTSAERSSNALAPRLEAEPAATPSSRDPVAEALASDPSLQNLRLAAHRAELATRYRELFQRLHLTPEQVAAFGDIILKRDQQEMDLAAIARENTASGAAAKVLEQQATVEFEAKQRALLGEDGFRALGDYDRTEPDRRFVNGVASSAAGAGVPLTASQLAALESNLDAKGSAGTNVPAALSGDSKMQMTPLQRQLLDDFQTIERFRTLRGTEPAP